MESFKIEGMGKGTIGGAGGKVLEVTRLDDYDNDDDNDKEGTLRWAVRKSFPRIVRFRISGVIHLKRQLDIEDPFITIDGTPETGVSSFVVRAAPPALPPVGPMEKSIGITIAGRTVAIKTQQVILHQLRIRRGCKDIKKRPTDSVGLDCINIDYSDYVVLDHISSSWSCDEIISITRSKHVTVQWCLISEPIGNPKFHPYGDDHAYCSNNSASVATYHHNIFYAYVMRGPQLEPNDVTEEDKQKGVTLRFDVVNNMMYGYERSGSRYYVGFSEKQFKTKTCTFLFQLINNLYLVPIRDDASEIEAVNDVNNYKFPAAPNILLYVHGNIGPHRPSQAKPQNNVVFLDHVPVEKAGNQKILDQLKKSELAPTEVETQDADTLEDGLLESVGCNGPTLKRDKVDKTVLKNIKEGKPAKIVHDLPDDAFDVKKLFN